MSTAGDIITRAIRLLGAVPSGETPSTNELADGLTAINAMMDSWRNEFLTVYALQDESVPISATNATRTVGPSGNYVTTRPLRIEDAYVNFGGVDCPVRVLQKPEWDAIPLKTATSSYPDRIYYEPTLPDGTIYLFPVPTTSSTLHIVTRIPLTAFAATSTAVALPPGWEDALAFNLAIRLSPEYELPVSQVVADLARSTKAAIKTINNRPLRPSNELAGMIQHRSFNINTGS